MKFIGNPKQMGVTHVTLEECIQWCKKQKVIGVDTETTGLNFLDDQLLLIQIGNREEQYIIDARYEDLSKLREVFESKDIVKILHNAKFDYKFLMKHNLVLCNIYDTKLAEKILTCGKDVSCSLKATTERRLGIEIEKETVLHFVNYSEDTFTEEMLMYSARDVENLLEIQTEQLLLAKKYGLMPVIELECDVVEVYSSMEYIGMGFNSERWLKNAERVIPEVEEAKAALNHTLTTEFRGQAEQEGFVQTSDELKINWRSSKHKRELLGLFYTLESYNKPNLIKFLKENPDAVEIDLFLSKEFSALEELLMKEHKEKLIELGYYIPKGAVKINWGSPQQRLEVFKWVAPGLQSTDKQSLAKIHHPMIRSYHDFINKQKLITTYGESWFKYVRSDGRVHTEFNQILNTGRISSSNPNMQNIPQSNLYRNCFEPHIEDYVFVSSDYSSQELVIIAYFSKDPVWRDALLAGEDLHSVAAELVFGREWLEAAEEDCIYMKSKKKCKCKEHQKLRTAVKTINFGLAYGMSEYKLSSTLDIPVEAARDLIEDYFATFPKIKEFLDGLAEFGMKKGYIRTFLPYGRIRWFPEWNGRSTSWKDKGVIERASKNTPIQGSAADMTKKALVLIQKEIQDKNLPVQIVMTVHDQIDTICHKDYAEEWKARITELMEEAALEIIEDGSLKAETEISLVWKK